MTAAEYKCGGGGSKRGENYEFIVPRRVKKARQTVFSETFRLMVNVGQQLVITCEIWGINGAGM